MPIIGATGFAAAASAAGTVAGSVAVAASFGGERLIIFLSLLIFNSMVQTSSCKWDFIFIWRTKRTRL